MFRRILVLVSVAIAATPFTFAASPSVTAVLSDSQPEVGQMVQLEIKVNGANSANVPETISIDGLEIHQTGTSRQFEMHNFDVTSSVTYSYTILPQKAGRFKIPPQTVRVGNDSLKTPELTLNVAQGQSSGSSTDSAQSGQAAVGSKLGFAELVIGKKDAYVGETIPAEIRLGFDTRARVQEERAAEHEERAPQLGAPRGRVGRRHCRSLDDHEPEARGARVQTHGNRDRGAHVAGHESQRGAVHHASGEARADRLAVCDNGFRIFRFDRTTRQARSQAHPRPGNFQRQAPRQTLRLVQRPDQTTL